MLSSFFIIGGILIGGARALCPPPPWLRLCTSERLAGKLSIPIFIAFDLIQSEIEFIGNLVLKLYHTLQILPTLVPFTREKNQLQKYASFIAHILG